MTDTLTTTTPAAEEAAQHTADAEQTLANTAAALEAAQQAHRDAQRLLVAARSAERKARLDIDGPLDHRIRRMMATIRKETDFETVRLLRGCCGSCAGAELDTDGPAFWHLTRSGGPTAAEAIQGAYGKAYFYHQGMTPERWEQVRGIAARFNIALGWDGTASAAIEVTDAL